MSFDRLLYRILTGSWGRFSFRTGAIDLDNISIPNPAGLYVHIPFCRSLCPFCPYTKILYEPKIAERYKRCLVNEADSVLSQLEDANVKVSSIYFGGGTPLTMFETVESLVRLVQPVLLGGAQIAVEVHPNDVSPSAVQRLGELGVNMVSLGVEALDDAVLGIIGRNHDSEMAISALDTLMNFDKTAVNADLIVGIPGQSLQSSTRDMSMLLDRQVDQVSAYPLMDFPYTKMKTRLSLHGQYRLLNALTTLGTDSGYVRSSVWTWTRPSSPKYTSITRHNYVGLGAGAASFLSQYFWLNTFDVEAYVREIEHGRSPVALSTCLNHQEASLYRLFWQCYEGEFDLGSGEALAIPLLPRLTGLAERLGLVDRASSAVRLTQKGFFLYHLLERYYTRRYIGRLWHRCRTSAFPAGLVL